jgi:ribonucleoside-diphosphate reductase alpha chain
MEEGYFDIAKTYIIYRDERQKLRDKQREKVEKKLEKNTLKIVKTNGKKENFDIEKVKNTYKRVSYKLARKCKFSDLENSLKKYIVEGMKTSDILNMMIKSSVDLVTIENTSWQFIAGRLQLLDVYKQASRNRGMDIKKIYEAKEYLKLFKEYTDT